MIPVSLKSVTRRADMSGMNDPVTRTTSAVVVVDELVAELGRERALDQLVGYLLLTSPDVVERAARKLSAVPA